MPSITIRNIPEDLLAKIKERAKKERRSLNNEILKSLEESEAKSFDFTSDWPLEELREAIEKGISSEHLEISSPEEHMAHIEKLKIK